MEDLIKKLRDYSRFLELEDSIPYWESQIPELKYRLEEMKWNQQQKEMELLNLKEPNFFQRTFGRAEEKKERINRQIREISSAKTAVGTRPTIRHSVSSRESTERKIDLFISASCREIKSPYPNNWKRRTAVFCHFRHYITPFVIRNYSLYFSQ
jgi:hypothetical protein